MKESTGTDRLSMPFLLLFSVFVIATCGLIYELVAGTLASYLLGDSVTQFSTIIGVYLFSMGIGSWLSKYFEKDLISWFIQLEILVGLVGGCSSAILFLLFDHVSSFRILLYLLVSITGILVGLEIPILMRILQNKFEFKDLVSRVFTFDYIGALLASVVFPLVLVPQLGILKTSFFFGILNVGVALLLTIKLKEEIRFLQYLQIAAITTIAFLIAGFVFADNIMNYAESFSFNEKVIYSKSTEYQRIVLTKSRKEIRLYLNGNLQFGSSDEYRYHEALVHPAMEGTANAGKILVLGGGDGLAVRELLKYSGVKEVTLVDLDPEITRLFSTHHFLTELNQNAFADPRVKIINRDAFIWVKNCTDQYDVVIVDFPDPGSYAVGKLYTNTFYKQLNRIIKNGGTAVVQSTSPFVAPRSFWCVENTIRSVGFNTLPYHVHVPSFGDWGFIIAKKGEDYVFPETFISGLQFLDPAVFKAMTLFPADMKKQVTEINKLNNQALVHYFEDEWNKYLQ